MTVQVNIIPVFQTKPGVTRAHEGCSPCVKRK